MNLFKVPAGVSSVTITATGSAGQTVNTVSAPGGTGDVMSGELSGLTRGQILDVCVDAGGGAAGAGQSAAADGGAGGGASGVALGSDFSIPVLIAAGGGGGAITNESGGGAGLPSGGAGMPSESCAAACGGTGGSQTTFGTGGAADRASCSSCTAGSPGAEFASTGPGVGGAGGTANVGQGGGGGGAGYYGGGGGGGARTNAGGGGGGSDFCASTLTGASLSSCAPTGANSTFGTASVVLSYSPPAWAHDFRDLVVDSRGVGPGATLLHKVRLAKSKFIAGDVSGACRMLDGYMREVNKQTGATVTKAQARDLIEDARETQRAIGCSRS